MEITFIGAGNLAWHLAPALENAGHHVNEVYSRQLAHTRQLVSMLYDAQPHSELNFADSPSELFVLAVPDDAIEAICARLVLPANALLVHTAGSLSVDQLRQWIATYSDVPVRTGVFYALQTFSRGQSLLPFAQIPLCIEASDAESESQLVLMGQDMSQIVYLVNSHERLALHVAAVFAGNFTNHVMALAKTLTDAENLEFALLKPLIRETIRKALLADDPAEVQTGPARRGDEATLARHEYYLAPTPDLLQVYQVLTDSIGRT